MRTRVKVGFGLLVVLAMLAVGAKYTGHADLLLWRLESEYARLRPEAASKAACKQEILSNAHDPDSIEWANENHWHVTNISTTQDGVQDWRVNMQVRGTNAFGAKVIADNTCLTSIGSFGILVTSLKRD